MSVSLLSMRVRLRRISNVNIVSPMTYIVRFYRFCSVSLDNLPWSQ